MDYEDYYYESRSRYYDACSEVNNYENRANELRSQRQRKIIYINQLKSDLKRHQKVLSELNAALKKDSILQDDIKSIKIKSIQLLKISAKWQVQVQLPTRV